MLGEFTSGAPPSEGRSSGKEAGLQGGRSRGPGAHIGDGWGGGVGVVDALMLRAWPLAAPPVGALAPPSKLSVGEDADLPCVGL